MNVTLGEIRGRLADIPLEDVTPGNVAQLAAEVKRLRAAAGGDELVEQLAGDAMHVLLPAAEAYGVPID